MSVGGARWLSGRLLGVKTAAFGCPEVCSSDHLDTDRQFREEKEAMRSGGEERQYSEIKVTPRFNCFFVPSNI